MSEDFGILAIAGLLIGVAWLGVAINQDSTKEEVMTEIPKGFDQISGKGSFYGANYRDHDLTGHYHRAGLSINFSSEPSEGCRPSDVIAATLHRMQFEQSTTLASDGNSRAIAYLLQAKTALEGGAETTEDGTPIIE